MGDKTEIEWTDATWNPVRGCSRVSPGCDNCYAMHVAHRFSGPGMPYEGLTVLRKGKTDWAGIARFVPDHLSDPLRWTKPRHVFVNSVSDLFHHTVSNEQIAAVFGVMAASPRHTFQVLTKRPERMVEWFEQLAADPMMEIAGAADQAMVKAGVEGGTCAKLYKHFDGDITEWPEDLRVREMPEVPRG